MNTAKYIRDRFENYQNKNGFVLACIVFAVKGQGVPCDFTLHNEIKSNLYFIVISAYLPSV